jgi:hypothetical protein
MHTYACKANHACRISRQGRIDLPEGFHQVQLELFAPHNLLGGLAVWWTADAAAGAATWRLLGSNADGLNVVSEQAGAGFGARRSLHIVVCLSCRSQAAHQAGSVEVFV